MRDPNIHTTLEADGILLARIDLPGRSMNVFSPELMVSLERLLDTVEADGTITGVILTSGKPSFLAGADLEMIRQFTEAARVSTPAMLHAVCGCLGRLFRRLEKSRKPYVAAINGLALGGGLELALACHARVAVDDPAVQLGVPEIKLGLLPGAGGTQRLPRLIGTAAALKMLLLGESVSASQALELRLVDELVAPSGLVDAARRLVRTAATVAPWDRPGAVFPEAPFDFSQGAETIADAVGISPEERALYPAYKAILKCVMGAWNKPMDAAIDWEMDCFVDLIRNPIAGNMVRALFLNRQKAAKLGLLGRDSALARDDAALLPLLRRARQRALQLRCSEPDVLLAVSLAAVGAWRAGKVAEPELADAAAVAERLHPPYTGGPFNYALQCGRADLRMRAAAAAAIDAELFTIPPGLEAFLASFQFAEA